MLKEIMGVFKRREEPFCLWKTVSPQHCLVAHSSLTGGGAAYDFSILG